MVVLKRMTRQMMLGMDREGFDDGGLSDWKEAKREADMKSRQRKPADIGAGSRIWHQLISADLCCFGRQQMWEATREQQVVTSIELHWATSSYIELHRAISSYIELYRATLSYIELHRATSSYIELHRGTSSYIELHRATLSYIELHRATSSYMWRMHCNDGANFILSCTCE